MTRTALALALAMLSLAGGAAQAQPANACQGRVVVNGVFQVKMSPSTYRYFVELRNLTAGALAVDLHFSGFPDSVGLFAPSRPGIAVGANFARAEVMFGSGTWAQLSLRTVAQVYDGAAGAGPTIGVSNCRAA